DLFRKYGFGFTKKISVHRWWFNLSCCAVSTWTMYALHETVLNLNLTYPLNLILGLSSIAIGWFVVNTGTVSLAVSFWNNRRFWSVWREGVILYLLKFLGSAGVAGLIWYFFWYDVVIFLFVCITIVICSLF